MASLASIKTDLRFLVDVSDNELGRRLLEDWDFVLRLLSGIAVKEAKTFELTEIIWGFFKACGREMELIQACLEYEVAHSTWDTVFREKTAFWSLIRVVFFSRDGLPYLRDTILPLVEELNAAKATEVSDIETNVTQVIHYTSSLIDRLELGIPNFPPKFRRVLGMIHEEMREMYAEELPAFPKTIVASFVFLHFINPALMTPIVSGWPTAQTGYAIRSEQLIGKMMQHLSVVIFEESDFHRQRWMQNFGEDSRQAAFLNEILPRMARIVNAAMKPIIFKEPATDDDPRLFLQHLRHYMQFNEERIFNGDAPQAVGLLKTNVPVEDSGLQDKEKLPRKARRKAKKEAKDRVATTPRELRRDDVPDFDPSRENDTKLIIVVGPPECGKSTFLKQARFALNKPPSDAERRRHRPVLWHNLHDLLLLLLHIAAERKAKLQRANRERASSLSQVKEVDWENQELIPGVLEHMSAVFRDKTLVSCYEKHLAPWVLKKESNFASEHSILDNAEYFWQNRLRIADATFVPTVDDLIRCRLPFRGVEEAMLTIDKRQLRLATIRNYRFTDKIMNLLGSADCIFFMVGLNDYTTLYPTADEMGTAGRFGSVRGQLPTKVPKKAKAFNSMKESLRLFRKLCRQDITAKVPKVLILNKLDVLQKKIHGIDLKACWPEYTGGDNLDASLEFIKGKFMAIQETSTHFLDALNEREVRDIVTQELELLAH